MGNLATRSEKFESFDGRGTDGCSRDETLAGERLKGSFRGGGTWQMFRVINTR